MYDSGHYRLIQTSSSDISVFLHLTIVKLKFPCKRCLNNNTFIDTQTVSRCPDERSVSYHIILAKDNYQMFAFEKLEPENLGHFLFKNDISCVLSIPALLHHLVWGSLMATWQWSLRWPIKSSADRWRSTPQSDDPVRLPPLRLTPAQPSQP